MTLFVIIPLLMVTEQFSDSKKKIGQIFAYNEWGLLLRKIAKKLNRNHSYIDAFKNYFEKMQLIKRLS